MSSEMVNEPVGEDIIFIFHNASKNEFLLLERAKTNSDLPGGCIFPSEKSRKSETPQETLHRGVEEEMGGSVKLTEVEELPLRMAHLLHGYPRSFRVFIVRSWEGEIQNMEPDKEKFVWAGRDGVMDKLSVPESKLIFLLVLAKIGQLKASDFDRAPKIQT